MATPRAKTPKTSRKSQRKTQKTQLDAPPTAWVRVPEESEVPQDVQVLFGKFKEKTGFIPNVARNFALTPEHFMRWFRYYDFLMRNEDQSHLTRKEREMIAVVVSSANECEYCLASHSAYLREISGDPVLPEVLAANFRRAHLSPREHALLEFAHQITVDSAVMSSADVQMLRAIGLSDEAIFEAAQVAAMFNFTNRIANAMGWVPNEIYYYLHREKK
ncbi:peroxidase-related enzyme [Meiothermus sp.]|uniref:peroxidase-related enzyme n=1 Tax=Meiothermus sp. TaxID=1955249 RepID=UPI0021DD0E97|nr:peroxidase-related enzyme [Meiothermus sp.]GIW23962.1 MAG: alkyl hydroperoxide reductase AhpD [Meiothermus sp.]